VGGAIGSAVRTFADPLASNFSTILDTSFGELHHFVVHRGSGQHFEELPCLHRRSLLGLLGLGKLMDDDLVQLRYRNVHAIVGEARVAARFRHDLSTKVPVLVQLGHTAAVHPDGAQVVVLHAFALEGVHVVASRLEIDAVSTIVAVLVNSDRARCGAACC